MQALLRKIRQILKDRRTRRFFTRAVSSVAAIVVFVTTYALILPAITLEKTASCGIEEHQHSDSCYEAELVCGQEESDGHHHDGSCYSIKTELSCESREHQHSAEDGCYDADGNLVCELQEHVHDDSCYEEVRTLTCGLEESEGHHHTDTCYEKVLVCGKEVHTHNEKCYAEDGSNNGDTDANTGNTSDGMSSDQADTGDTAPEVYVPDATTEEAQPDSYVPELDPLDMEALLNGHTDFYYFHAEEEEEVPTDSAEISDWRKVEEDTTLTSTDLVKVYLAYMIPAGSLNESNPVARYRLPENIHLTDDQIDTMNRYENGIAAGYRDSDASSGNYQKYLGAEAVEGDRRPDEELRDDAQEYISAVVRAENVYSDNGQYLGQDLIFTFVPYSIDKNRDTYDADQTLVSAGEKITGWFACDFRLDQIDWESETETANASTENTENAAGENITEENQTAKVIFAGEDQKEGIKEISRRLRLSGQNTKRASDEAQAETSEDTGKDGEDENDQIFKSGTLTAEGDDYKIILDYSEEAKIPENASLSVREITAETDKEAYEACLAQAGQQVAADDQTSVDQKASRFFDIEILATETDSDGTEKTLKIEPAAPVSVNIQINDTPAMQENKSEQSEPTVLHFAEEGVEQIDSTASTDSAKGHDSEGTNTEISFEAESFSIYGVVYTVDFEYSVNGKMYQFSLPGGGFVSFTDLVEVLGITHDTNSDENREEENESVITENAEENPANKETEENEANSYANTALTLSDVEVSEATRKLVADVDSVESSSPSLVDVSKVEADTTVGQIKESRGLECEYSAELTEEQIAQINAQTVEAGDWALISMHPFASEETLTVTMKNGDQFVLKVTDAQIFTHVITARGETFVITVTYTDEAEIPETGQLHAREITKEDPAFEEYRLTAGEVLDEEPDGEDLRLFDISILDKASQNTTEAVDEESQRTPELAQSNDDSDGIKIEPKAPVHVSIEYVGGMDLAEDQGLEVVHFAEDGPEHLESITAVEEGSVSSVEFETSCFSAFATIRERITEDMANGCIAYFSFDNTADGFSGAGATATRNGNTSLRDGQSGTALYLNGDGWLNVTGGSNGHLLTGLDEFTVSYWSSTTAATSDGSHGNWAYYAAPNGNGQAWRSEKYVGVVQTGNGITAERYNSNNNDRPQSNTADAPMNEWHHITVVYKNGSTQLYVDGQLASEVESSVDLSNMLGNNNIFQIGRANWGNGEGFKGYIDEFSVFNYALDADEVRLLHENAYYQEAKKVSVQNLQKDKSYIIYNEVWNPDAGLTGAYEYYAVDGNGNLVKVYNKSDLIHYRADISLEWKLIAYEENGQETGYYEFYNEETGKYLAPQAAQLLSDEVIGLHLNGRQDGQYESTIEAWDGRAMSYYGYKYEKEGGQWKLTTASESETAQNRDWEFFFAEPDQEKPVGQLETVDTVTNPNGLTIQMFDYPYTGAQYTEGHSSYSDYQNQILSGLTGNSNEAKQWHNSHVTTGILKNVLENGYPKASITGQSLSPLFTGGKTVDNLFIQSTYDESGYYEYSSFENYAYLGNSNNFTVYKQIGAPSAPSNQSTNPEKYYRRGNFLPYNPISADTSEPYDLQKNYVDEFLGDIPEDDPRYGELIYRAQGNLNYHFGMNITADFLMPNGGEDSRGNPVTFEFNGDDDMWVFVDGVLLLDMGGCHHAHSGSINFETGDIVVQNRDGQNRTNIKECYRKAHVYPDGTPWPEGDDSLVDKYFRGNTYVDYSAHQLQMYFMERGGGASNLHVKFNLPILEPGTLKISKELEDADPRYAHETYQFQICRQDGAPVTSIGGANDDITSLKNEKTGETIRIDPQGRFSLKAGETAVASVRNSSLQYLIKEIGMNSADYDVTINGQTALINNGEAASSVDTVQNRPSVLVKNKPKHLGDLRITKQIEGGIHNPQSPRFEFYVYFENQNGEIVPYSQGIYYVMKGDLYCEYRDGNLVELPQGQKPAPLRSGQYGAIANIPPEYSIYIPDLMPGTHFLVTERLDTMPQGYEFVKKELKADSYDAATSQSTYNNTPVDGKIKADTMADVIVTNRDIRTKDITIKKVTKEKVGPNPAELLDGAVFKIEKYLSLNPMNIDTTWNTAHSSDNTGQNGVFNFGGLPIGYYKIIETNLPAGYVKLENDPVFQIAVNGTTGELEVVLLDNNGFPVQGNATEMIVVNDTTIVVGNEPGAALPNTGGPGTRLFTILGSILILGAGVLLWRRRRLI